MNTSIWIVGLIDLHEKSIENRMSGGNKSYNNEGVTSLHFRASC